MNTNYRPYLKKFLKLSLVAGMAVVIPTACGHDDIVKDTPAPKPDIPTVDTTSPVITVHLSSVDITGVEEILISGNQLHVGDKLVASWTDNVTKSCQVKMTFDGSPVSSGNVPDKSGTLTLTVTDDAGNSSSKTISLKMEEVFPDLTILIPEVNVFGGVELQLTDTQLLIGGDVVAEWSDKRTEKCKASLSFNGQEVNSGDVLSEPGTLTLTVTNDQDKSSTAEITLTNDSIFGIENLRNATIQVDKEVNILEGITFAEGVELVKTEIEIDNKRNTVSDPNHYTPDYPGTMNVIFTLRGKSGNTMEVNVDNLVIKPLDYRAMEVTNIKPVDILPIIGQIEAGDKNAYDHIEHLRIAEATRIRDMMWKYGAGNHSAEEYQQLMMRLHTGMTLEHPKGYDNYEIIGGDFYEEPTNHAHDERNILNTLVDHTTFNIIDSGDRKKKLQEYIDSHPDDIYIFGNSAFSDFDKLTYETIDNEATKRLCKSKNFLIFVAGGNIREKNGILRNKTYHEDVNGDEHGLYSLPSSANGKNDASADRHMIVSIGTDADGDIDQTYEIYESSRYPVGFHNNILFSGRSFPYKALTGKIEAYGGKYPTSYVNYTNVAIADLCFQMKADVADVDELLNMIRSSTNYRDHIRFNGEDQPLILMNPAGFFKKYLMPTDLPTAISWRQTVALDKGYYHGLVFDIPGAEVKVNGEWIRYNEQNKATILAQNPFTLEWRLNGDLLRKLGYGPANPVSGRIIAVDDQWNGLSLSQDITIQVTE